MKEPFFEILDNFWILIKPYVNSDEAKTYKKIMSDEYRMLTKDRGKKFTDSWWKSTRELIDYPEQYKGTKFCNFAAELAIAISDFWMAEMKGNESTRYQDFMRFVGHAFISEWERVREMRT